MGKIFSKTESGRFGNRNLGGHDYYNLLNNLKEIDKVKLYNFVKQNCNKGANPTDEQLENMLQALHRSDEKRFIQTIIDITTESISKGSNDFRLPGTEDFYTINAYHARHDKFVGNMCPSLKGKTVNSAFNGSILARNYKNVLDTLPAHVAIRTLKEVEMWAKTITIESSHPNGVEPYHIDRPNAPKEGVKCFMEDTNYRTKFVHAVERIDWMNSDFDVYAIVPFDENPNGPVFGPAFNSLWIIRNKSEAEPSASLKLWFIHSAFADGTPATGYFGLEFDTPILSRAGVKFSPLSDERNFYRVTLSENPIAIKIEAFHHQYHLCDPYFVVDCVFKPATMEEIKKTVGELNVDDMWNESIKKTTAMILKGALMEELLTCYYPNANFRQLFDKLEDPAHNPAKNKIKDDNDGKSPENAVNDIPISMNRAIVGNLLGAFKFFSTNRHGIWILPPTVEDTDLQGITCDMKKKRCKLTRMNLIQRSMDLSEREVDGLSII